MSALVIDELSELVQGVSQVSPGPLFLIDEVGESHALNGLAQGLSGEDSSERAFVSPVALGERGHGKVIGYVPVEADAEERALLSALVALVAALVSRHADEPSRLEPPAAGREESEAVEPDSALGRACRELAESGEERAVGEILVRASVRALAGDRAALFVRGARSGGLEAVATTGLGGMSLEPVVSGQGPLGRALAGGRATVLAALPGRPSDESRRPEALASELALRPPLACLPITSGPERLGLLVVGLPPGSEDPGPAALASLERLTDKAAATLAGLRLLRQGRRAERVTRELEIAQQVQACLLPAGDFENETFALAGECRPAAQVGGDYFGHVVDEEGRPCIVLFDVAGHGIGAAICMTMIRSILRGQSAAGDALAAVLTRANRLVWEDLRGSGLFATAFLARHDAQRAVLEYASAGHAPPIHWVARARAFRDRPEGGLPLGLLPGSAYRHAETAFASGDLLVAYTDGIVEARDPSGEKFGRHRLMGVIRRLRHKSARRILRALWREVETFARGRSLDDDATLVVLRARENARGTEAAARRAGKTRSGPA